MIPFMRSRSAAWLCATAAFSMSAVPAFAQPRHDPYWHHHYHHHGDGGVGLLAGLLVVGGVAAIAASAANNSQKNEQVRDDEDYDAPPATYAQQPAYPGGPLPGDDDRPVYDPGQSDGAGFARAAPYTGPTRSAFRAGAAADDGAVPIDADEDIGFDGAVGACASEVTRDGGAMGKVDNVARTSRDGYRVDARTGDGRVVTCTMDSDGRIRTAAIDGHGII